MSKKGKLVKWHVSLGPINPRIGIAKMPVTEYLLKKFNQEIIARTKIEDMRKVPVYIDPDDYNTILYEFKTISPYKPAKELPIYLYGDGVLCIMFRCITFKPKEKPEDQGEEKPATE